MKKAALFLLLFTLMILPVQADSLEQVRVVKFWEDTDDLIIERNSGEKLLIQHHKGCSSMNTELPVKLVWQGSDIVSMKVAANEICDVYAWGPFGSEVKLLKRIESGNALIAAHEAEVEWNGDTYEIDYADGCRGLKDYIGEKAYLDKANALEGANLYLPKARGKCKINLATKTKEGTALDVLNADVLTNLRIKAENNQAFFSWDAFPDDGEIWIAQVTYSKFPFNPAEYELTQLPNLKRTRLNTMRVLQLVNDQKYYFYISATNGQEAATEWRPLEITPKLTRHTFKNKPDGERFEIEMNETDDAFVLTWPDKGEISRRYLIQIWVDGKREVFKTITPEKAEFVLEKRPEWSRSRFRMVVRTIPTKPTGARYHDSIFWRKG